MQLRYKNRTPRNIKGPSPPSMPSQNTQFEVNEYMLRKANGTSNIKSNGKAMKNSLGNLPKTSPMLKILFTIIGLANARTTLMIISLV